MSKIRILAVPSDQHGVGKFRILDPYKYIGDNYTTDFHVDISFDVPNEDKFFDNYDIVVFHSFIHKTTHEENIKRINWLKTNGIKPADISAEDFTKDIQCFFKLNKIEYQKRKLK